jgi:hypothetical protein
MTDQGRGTLLTTPTTRPRLAPGLVIKSMAHNNLAVDHSVVKSAAIAYLTIHAQHVARRVGTTSKAGRSWVQRAAAEMGPTYRKCTTSEPKVPDDREHKGTKLDCRHVPQHKWLSCQNACRNVRVFLFVYSTRIHAAYCADHPSLMVQDPS